MARLDGKVDGHLHRDGHHHSVHAGGLGRRRGRLPCDDGQRPLPDEGRRPARRLALPSEAGRGSPDAPIGHSGARTGTEATDRQRSRSVDPTKRADSSSGCVASRACLRPYWCSLLSIGRATCRAVLARPLGLNRRARHRAIGAEHATIAGLWLQLCAATGALVKELTSIGRHGLRFRDRAMRTSDGRLNKHRINSWARMDNLPSWWPRSVGSDRLWHRHK